MLKVDYLKSGNYEGAESVTAKPKTSSPETDQNKINPSDKSETTAHADAKKEGPASSVEAANEAADDTSEPVDITPVKRRGRPRGQKSLEKKAAGKNQPSSDVKKIDEATDSAGKITKQSAKDDVKSSVKKIDEATDSAGKITKQSAKDDGKSSVKKAGEGESSNKHKKINSKQEKDETLSEEDPSKDMSLKVSLY
jgi:hypothetical protein